MNNTTAAYSINTSPDLFWRRFETLDDSSRLLDFYSYANFMVDACEAGLVTRRQLGVALSPAWNAATIRDLPDVFDIADLARDFKSGAIESTEESQWIFNELASIVRRHR